MIVDILQRFTLYYTPIYPGREDGVLLPTNDDRDITEGLIQENTPQNSQLGNHHIGNSQHSGRFSSNVHMRARMLFDMHCLNTSIMEL